MNCINELRKIRFNLISRVSFHFGVQTVRGIIMLASVLIPISIIAPSNHAVYAVERDSLRQQHQAVNSEASEESDAEDMIDGTADEMEIYEKNGLTILIGQVKIKRPNGFLNADKVTIHKDTGTGDTTKTVAQGNVEIRDTDLFATCEHAILNHIDDTVDLRDNVVVIQNKDRLEAKHFTFNRRTGKQTGHGGVRFKVLMKKRKKQEEATEQAEQQ